MVANQELPIPRKPPADMTSVPDDVTELSDSALMKLFGRLSGWQKYLATQLALAEVDEKYLSRRLARIEKGYDFRRIADKERAAKDPDYEAAQGRTVHAIEIYEELMQKVMLTQPKPESSLTDAVNLSRIYAAIAGLNRLIGRNDRASTLEAQRLALWRRWDARLPNNTFVRRRLNDASGPVQ